MAEPCDPEVLHSRLSVVESKVDQHGTDINNQRDDITNLKLCTACLPSMSSDIREIKTSLINSQSIKSFWDSATGKLVWDIVRWAAIAIIMYFFTLSNHVVVT